MKTEIEEGVAAKLGGLYWGTQYEDGHTTDIGWGPIENADIADPEFCTKPTDMTYEDDPSIHELSESKLVKIRKTTVTEEIE